DALMMREVLSDLETRPAVSGRSPTAEARQEIRKAVILAKCALSERAEADIVVERVVFDAAEDAAATAAPYDRSVSRDEFESLIRPVVERTLGPWRQALADAGLKASQIDEVILVGGSTRIPLVRRLVEALFGKAPHSELNPDEVVALGA